MNPSSLPTDKHLATANSALEDAEEIQEDSIQELALKHAPNAIEGLAKFSKGRKVGGIAPTAQVVRAAQRDIIEFAGGRPETRDPRVGDGSQNLTVVLQRFTDGTTRRVDYDNLSAEEAVFREAEDLLESKLPEKRSVARTFTVPDTVEEFEFDEDEIDADEFG